MRIMDSLISNENIAIAALAAYGLGASTMLYFILKWGRGFITGMSTQYRVDSEKAWKVVDDLSTSISEMTTALAVLKERVK
jgi:hypothetical protein